MQPINLNTVWQTAISTTTDPPVENWQATQHPQQFWVPKGASLWYRHSLEMPVNDECSVWWLECEGVGYACEVWVNGQLIGTHEGGITRCRWEVTAALQLETNLIMLRVYGNPNSSSLVGIWGQMWLVPYDCQQPPQVNDWYLPSAEAFVHIDPETLQWWRDELPFFPRGILYQPERTQSADLFERDVFLIKQAQFNIIRVTGQVLPDYFYRLCDEQGIFVWQDFPLTLDNPQVATSEFERMVLQLRHHPCVAVWGLNSHPANAFAQTLQALAHKLDPERHVQIALPSSTATLPLQFDTGLVQWASPLFLSEKGDSTTREIKRQCNFIKFAGEYYRAHKEEGISGIFYDTLVGDSPVALLDGDHQPTALYTACAATMKPLLPIALLPFEWYEALPLRQSLPVSLLIVNDLPHLFTRWSCRVSLTSWIPSTESSDEKTYMYHWKHTYSTLDLKPCSKHFLGDIQIPALVGRSQYYQLVLQLFTLEDDTVQSVINTYTLQVAT